MMCHGCIGFRWADFGWCRTFRSGIKVCRLQRRGCSLTLARLRFFALETITHPFAHVWLLTQRHTRGQWMRLEENQDRQAKNRIAGRNVGDYNVAMPVPPEIHDQKYISLITFRRNGTAVPTPR